jgi:hypothetical protein
LVSHKNKGKDICKAVFLNVAGLEYWLDKDVFAPSMVGSNAGFISLLLKAVFPCIKRAGALSRTEKVSQQQVATGTILNCAMCQSVSTV